MGWQERLFSGVIEKRVAEQVAAEKAEIVKTVPVLVEAELAKQYTGPNALASGLQRYNLDYNVYDKQAKRKPNSDISFEMLRRFSTTNEIVRAAINARKRQITQLQWEIVTVDKNDRNDYSKQIADVHKRLKGIGGYKVRFRELLDTIIEDLLVIDAVALYKQRTIGGELLSLIPVDGATITLRVDGAGNTPRPPEIAYKQIINGQVVAELTADEMLYEMMNPRTTTPYGLPPIESLVLVISSMLRSELYNLNYLTDGNIPEGIFHVPETWSADMIKEFQETWDAYLAGDPKATSRMRFMPGGQGAGYVPTKKPTDMAFKEFNTWLMEIICALFDIPPQELGFTGHQSTRANAKEQTDIAMRRSMTPLANFLTEIFNDIIQDEWGFENLQFKYLGIEDRDMLVEAQVMQIELASGLRTVDELREDRGYAPLGITDPYVIGVVNSLTEAMKPAPPDVEQPGADGQGGTSQQVIDPGTDKPKKADEPEVTKVDFAAIAAELRKMRGFAVNRLSDGKKLRPFESDILPATTVAELNAQLAGCSKAEEARGIFDEFSKDHQIAFLADVQALKKDLSNVLAA